MDPEILSEGVQLCQRFFFFFFFLVDEGLMDPNSTISRPSLARQQKTTKWRFAGVLMMAKYGMLAR